MDKEDRATELESMVRAALSKVDPKAAKQAREKLRLLKKHRAERKARNKRAKRQRKINRRR